MADNPDLKALMKSLSFEVEAVPHDNIIQLTSSADTTPLNVKIKVRKKRNADAQEAVISMPKYGRPGGGHERIRLVSSDQTIMSFKMYMENVTPGKVNKKQGKSFFGKFKPGGCLDLNNRDNKDEPYLPKSVKVKERSSLVKQGQTKSNDLLNTKQSPETSSSRVIKNDNKIYVLKKNADEVQLGVNKGQGKSSDVSLKAKNNLENLEPRTEKVYFLGKCKPGGCLDPPFGEEKYAYKPTKSPHDGSITDLKVLQQDDFVIKQENLLPKTKIKNLDGKESTSVLSLFKSESIQPTSSYSHNIITYPPASTSSAENLYDQKSDKTKKFKKGSVDSYRKPFAVSTDNYFFPKSESMGNARSVNIVETDVHAKSGKDLIVDSVRVNSDRMNQAMPLNLAKDLQITIESTTKASNTPAYNQVDQAKSGDPYGETFKTTINIENLRSPHKSGNDNSSSENPGSLKPNAAYSDDPNSSRLNEETIKDSQLKQNGNKILETRTSPNKHAIENPNDELNRSSSPTKKMFGNKTSDKDYDNSYPQYPDLINLNPEYTENPNTANFDEGRNIKDAYLSNKNPIILDTRQTQKSALEVADRNEKNFGNKEPSRKAFDDETTYFSKDESNPQHLDLLNPNTEYSQNQNSAYFAERKDAKDSNFRNKGPKILEARTSQNKKVLDTTDKNKNNKGRPEEIQKTVDDKDYSDKDVTYPQHPDSPNPNTGYLENPNSAYFDQRKDRKDSDFRNISPKMLEPRINQNKEALDTADKNQNNIGSPEEMQNTVGDKDATYPQYPDSRDSKAVNIDNSNSAYFDQRKDAKDSDLRNKSPKLEDARASQNRKVLDTADNNNKNIGKTEPTQKPYADKTYIDEDASYQQFTIETSVKTANSPAYNQVDHAKIGDPHIKTFKTTINIESLHSPHKNGKDTSSSEYPGSQKPDSANTENSNPFFDERIGTVDTDFRHSPKHAERKENFNKQASEAAVKDEKNLINTDSSNKIFNDNTPLENRLSTDTNIKIDRNTNAVSNSEYKTASKTTQVNVPSAAPIGKGINIALQAQTLENRNYQPRNQNSSATTSPRKTSYAANRISKTRTSSLVSALDEQRKESRSFSGHFYFPQKNTSITSKVDDKLKTLNDPSVYTDLDISKTGNAMNQLNTPDQKPIDISNTIKSSGIEEADRARKVNHVDLKYDAQDDGNADWYSKSKLRDKNYSTNITPIDGVVAHRYEDGNATYNVKKMETPDTINLHYKGHIEKKSSPYMLATDTSNITEIKLERETSAKTLFQDKPKETIAREVTTKRGTVFEDRASKNNTKGSAHTLKMATSTTTVVTMSQNGNPIKVKYDDSKFSLAMTTKSETKISVKSSEYPDKSNIGGKSEPTSRNFAASTVDQRPYSKSENTLQYDNSATNRNTDPQSQYRDTTDQRQGRNTDAYRQDPYRNDVDQGQFIEARQQFKEDNKPDSIRDGSRKEQFREQEEHYRNSDRKISPNRFVDSQEKSRTGSKASYSFDKDDEKRTTNQPNTFNKAMNSQNQSFNKVAIHKSVDGATENFQRSRYSKDSDKIRHFIKRDSLKSLSINLQQNDMRGLDGWGTGNTRGSAVVSDSYRRPSGPFIREQNSNKSPTGFKEDNNIQNKDNTFQKSQSQFSAKNKDSGNYLVGQADGFNYEDTNIDGTKMLSKNKISSTDDEGYTTAYTNGSTYSRDKIGDKYSNNEVRTTTQGLQDSYDNYAHRKSVDTNLFEMISSKAQRNNTKEDQYSEGFCFNEGSINRSRQSDSKVTVTDRHIEFKPSDEGMNSRVSQPQPIANYGETMKSPWSDKMRIAGNENTHSDQYLQIGQSEMGIKSNETANQWSPKQTKSHSTSLKQSKSGINEDSTSRGTISIKDMASSSELMNTNLYPAHMRDSTGGGYRKPGGTSEHPSTGNSKNASESDIRMRDSKNVVFQGPQEGDSSRSFHGPVTYSNSIEYHDYTNDSNGKTITRQEPQNFVELDLAFQKHIDKDKPIGSFIKSYNIEDMPSHVEDDSVISFQAMVPIGTDVKLPVDSEYALHINVQKKEDKQSDTDMFGRKFTRRSERKDRELEIILNSIYVQHLVPLQNIISSLKEDIDNLVLQKDVIRQAAYQRKRSLRMHKIRKCSCSKYTF